MSELEEKTPRYVFSGLAKDYPTWSTKYIARANMKKFADILTKKVVLRTKGEIDAETDATVKIKDENIVSMNLKAYSDMLLSVDTETPDGNDVFDLIISTVDDDYPDGNAYEAWEKLRLEMEPTTINSYVKLSHEFKNRGLKEGEKPLTWITDLGKIRKRLKEVGHPVNDLDFFIHIIGFLPIDYYEEQKDFKKRLDSKSLTLKYIKDELKSAYEIKFKKNDDEDEEGGKEGEDVALAMGNFKGYCKNCGKYGHKKIDCPELQQNGNNGGGYQNGVDRGQGYGRRRFNGKCFFCGKRGHKQYECRSNPANANNGGNTNWNNGGNQNNKNNDDWNEEEVAEIMLVASEPTKTVADKKYYWADWCEECEEDDEYDEYIMVNNTNEKNEDKYIVVDTVREETDDVFTRQLVPGDEYGLVHVETGVPVRKYDDGEHELEVEQSMVTSENSDNESLPDLIVPNSDEAVFPGLLAQDDVDYDSDISDDTFVVARTDDAGVCGAKWCDQHAREQVAHTRDNCVRGRVKHDGT